MQMLALKKQGSVNSLRCQVDEKPAGAEMLNELGQPGKVTDIL